MRRGQGMSSYLLIEIIHLLQRLTHSNSTNLEQLYYESRDLLSPLLAADLLTLCSNPARYDDDQDFLEDIIQELKAELFI